jgi:single-strand DNA-binding protein
MPFNEPIITIVGNVGSEPELRFTPSGAAVCNFSVAVTPRRKDPQTQEWGDGEPTWYRVNAWRSLAENLAESITKGSRVIVVGRLENRKYESREGGTGYSLEITADACGPDCQWAMARVQRPDRGQGGGNAGARPADDPWTTDAPAQGGGQRRQQQGGGGGQYGGRQGGGQYDNRGGGQQRMDQGDPWGSAPQGGQGGFADEPPF